MNLTKHLPTTILQFIKIYLTAISFFALFRLILLFTEIGRLNDSTTSDIFLSFIMGIRFDLVISGYILIFPYLILTALSFTNLKTEIINKIAIYFIGILFSLTFITCAIDIPYFNQFFARLSITAFEWLDDPSFVFKMIAEEPRYWLFAIPVIVIIYLFIRIIKKILSKPAINQKGNFALKISLSILFLGFIILGIRGRIERKSPIRVGTAYFCNDAFLNQLGLNPNFTLIRSYLDSKKKENIGIQLLDDKIAIANIQKYLDIKNPNKKYPLFRKINFEQKNSTKTNVIIIIMESMTAANMERNGNPNNLTPFLDSISNKGYYFDNTYSAGIHTFNGVFGTLFSYPAIFRQNPMKESSMQKYHSILSTLKEKGYSTTYFITHDGQFDNMEGFLKANDCETVISQSNYPQDKVKTTLGVPDDYMFEFSIPIINQQSEKGKPFFVTLMTTSNHGPFYLPDYYKPRSKDIKSQMVEYADYSLRKFMNLASKQKWYKNTLFVFVADHGSPINGLYDMSIDYNHIPLLFYAPEIIKDPKTFSCMASQTDVFPSIMGLLKIPYNNNTLGIDLLNETRPYCICNADDKYGVFDNDWFLIVKEDKSEGLYKYRNKDTHNYAAENKNVVEQMNKYAKSNLQSFQYIIRTNKQ